MKRKPSPMLFNDEGMVETVGLVWGVSREVLDKDADSIRRHGSLEQVSIAFFTE